MQAVVFTLAVTETVRITCSGWQQWFAPGEEVIDDVNFEYSFYYKFDDDPDECVNFVIFI